MSLVERAVEEADAGALVALIAACDETYRAWAPAGWAPPEVPADWRARVREPDRWSLVAAEPSFGLVAFASFRPAFARDEPGARSGPPLPGLAHVGALYVHPLRWRRGIGAAMLARAEAAMRERGFARARLWTPDGAPAERFYRTLGWEPDGRRAWNEWLGLQVVGYGKRVP